METGSWTAACVMLDQAEKSGHIRVLQAELNDQPGVCIKITGALSHVEAAVRAAEATGEGMHAACICAAIANPAPGTHGVYAPPAEINALIEQQAVTVPSGEEQQGMKEQADFAVGLIETQGFTAVFEAIDTAIKTAAVEVIGREKLGGGYITVMIKGDVAAVRAAIEAGKSKVDGLGKLIAAHVIARPSQGVLSLLPKS
ncbi:MAG TPA: BMC domain-containing protein [Bryobacteraceae bacterium]|nr:BMC domain-containing protein [Bryobacteraceae bacterium]